MAGDHPAWAGGRVGNIRPLPLPACHSCAVQDQLEFIMYSKSLLNLHHEGLKAEMKKLVSTNTVHY